MIASIGGDDFAERLTQAIARSAKVINAKPVAPVIRSQATTGCARPKVSAGLVAHNRCSAAVLFRLVRYWLVLIRAKDAPIHVKYEQANG